MGVTLQILSGTVMHKRLFPKINTFSYGIYYLALPLSQLGIMPLAHNRFAPISFYDKDHGPRDGSSLQTWADNILKKHNITKTDGGITLLCMPRIFGYVFNPVSFWLCHDKQGNIRAILCDVHNTFGESHTYICTNKDQHSINSSATLSIEKTFHVSPFLEREGRYDFRFNITEKIFAASIDFYDENEKKQLITSLIGRFQPLTKPALWSVFWKYPLITFKAISLIHWQALKIISKGIKYKPKPDQHIEKDSITKL